MAASWPQPLPQPLQLPPAHRAFLGDAVGTLGEDIELAVLGQQLDLDARRGPLARACPARCFSKSGEAPLRRSDQILHRRIAAAHLGQHLFGRDAAIHHPDPPGLAVLLLDLARGTSASVVLSAVLPGSTS